MNQQLDNTLARFCEAWNRHDADALAEMWTDDGELNHPWGQRAFGREAIRQLLADEHETSMAASQLRITSVTSLSHEPNVVAEIDGVLDDVSAPNGRRYSLPHRMSVMFVAADGEWRIRTMTPLPK